MNFESKLGRLMRNSGPARFFVPLGIILIVVGIILLSLNTGSYEQTTGKVTAVTEGVYDTEEKQQLYNVSVSYTADGKEYNGMFENLSGSFKAGDEIPVYYNPEEPEKITNAKIGGFIPPIVIGVGVLAAAFGLYRTIKAFKKSKALDEASPTANFDGFKQSQGVTEYYFRWDGNSLKPGYLIEDADRRMLFEGKMLKNALVGARTFAFTDCASGKVSEHEVGHTLTQTQNDSMLAARSSFKFDGQNIWDLLHERGLHINTSVLSRFPNLVYQVSKDGTAFAQIESTGMYVHEDDAQQHAINVPTGRMYYRCWTVSNDFETLFLTMFAISETEQTVVE